MFSADRTVEVPESLLRRLFEVTHELLGLELSTFLAHDVTLAELEDEMGLRDELLHEFATADVALYKFPRVERWLAIADVAEGPVALEFDHYPCGMQIHVASVVASSRLATLAELTSGE